MKSSQLDDRIRQDRQQPPCQTWGPGDR